MNGPDVSSCEEDDEWLGHNIRDRRNDPEDTSVRREEEVYRLAGTLMGKMHEIHPWRLSPDRSQEFLERRPGIPRGSTNRRKADEIELEGKT